MDGRTAPSGAAHPRFKHFHHKGRCDCSVHGVASGAYGCACFCGLSVLRGDPPPAVINDVFAGDLRLDGALMLHPFASWGYRGLPPAFDMAVIVLIGRGATVLQCCVASGHRGWNAHPEGGLMGFG